MYFKTICAFIVVLAMFSFIHCSPLAVEEKNTQLSKQNITVPSIPPTIPEQHKKSENKKPTRSVEESNESDESDNYSVSEESNETKENQGVEKRETEEQKKKDSSKQVNFQNNNELSSLHKNSTYQAYGTSSTTKKP